MKQYNICGENDNNQPYMFLISHTYLIEKISLHNAHYSGGEIISAIQYYYLASSIKLMKI